MPRRFDSVVKLSHDAAITMASVPDVRGADNTAYVFTPSNGYICRTSLTPVRDHPRLSPHTVLPILNE